MKLKKRKIKYAAIFFICWFAFLVILVDGVLKFQTLVDYFGSYALVELSLLLLVIIPTVAVYILTKENGNSNTWRSDWCSGFRSVEAYEAIAADGQRLGGAIIVIKADEHRGELAFLYVKVGVQSKSIGQTIWKAIEAMHPETEVWETCTPYFDRRNIHFYNFSSINEWYYK